MLAYVQTYHFTDQSLELGSTQEQQIIWINREGPKEVVSVTALDEGIGIMKKEDKE